jgi:cation:H+ antiporter
MPPLLADTLLILAGFVLLAKGAHWLVDGGATLARRWGVSPLVIGLTVVAWGTSLPEVVVSALAAYRNKPASSLGNVLGSNIANIGLVLGVCAVILPSVLLGRVQNRERIWLLGSIGGLWLVCDDRLLSRPEALLLLVAFGLYNLLVLRTPREEPLGEGGDAHGSRRPWLAVIVGSAGIAWGANLVMGGAEGMAAHFELSDGVVGLTIFALGTSLPELAAGVTSARRGHPEIGFGNVIGSNVFNTLAVMGIAGLIRPFAGPEAEGQLAAALSSDFPVVMGFSLVLVTLPLIFKQSAGKAPGYLLALAYVGYMAWILLAR